MLANLIGGFIVILVGVTLLPTVAEEVAKARYINGDAVTGTATNVTGAASTLLNLTTLFYALGIMAAGISLAVTGLRQAGLV